MNDAGIAKGDLNHVILVGFGADHITTGNGNNIVLGDSGAATFDPTSGDLISIFSTFDSATPSGTNPDNGTSSNDVITLGNGNNVVIGGAGNNTIIVGQRGADGVMGAGGEADYTDRDLTDIFGGTGNDTILLGGGNNDVVGDDG
jgi:hypothetical protein